jgi:hypothetical protein
VVIVKAEKKIHVYFNRAIRKCRFLVNKRISDKTKNRRWEDGAKGAVA